MKDKVTYSRHRFQSGTEDCLNGCGLRRRDEQKTSGEPRSFSYSTDGKTWSKPAKVPGVGLIDVYPCSRRTKVAMGSRMISMEEVDDALEWATKVHVNFGVRHVGLLIELGSEWSYLFENHDGTGSGIRVALVALRESVPDLKKREGT